MLARWLYSLIFCLALPLILLRLKQRAKANAGYGQRVHERFGRYQSAKPAPDALWFHAVSVGEVAAARPLIQRFLELQPEQRILITTTTPTGSDRVLAAYGDLLAQGRVLHSYLPYDLPWAVRGFLRHFQPKVGVIMETELWPNLIRGCQRHGVPLMLVNARLSEKSYRGYRRIHWLARPMLRSLSLVASQHQADGERFLALGLDQSQLQVTGTLKFDVEVSAAVTAQAKAMRQQWGAKRPVFIAASTHQGEDELVLAAFKQWQQQQPDALLVLVPRHPERFEAVAELVQGKGFSCAKFSDGNDLSPDQAVLLGDVMGQLLPMLGAADMAFMGGSLVPVGGHNMLEALAMGTPVVTGPHIHNFQALAEQLSAQGVLAIVPSAAELAQWIEQHWQQQAERERLAQQGLAIMQQHRGAADRLYRLVSAQAGLGY